MSDDPTFLTREHIGETLLEFERRIEQRLLPVSHSECWDLLLNRPPSRGAEPPNAPDDPVPLRYETREGGSLLHVIRPDARNRACAKCELFGQSHCCGGVVFLYYALRDSGVTRPLEWLAVEIEPGAYLPDWERMEENKHRILIALRAHLEVELLS